MSQQDQKLLDLLEEVQRLFDQDLGPQSLVGLSKSLQAEFKQHLALESQCMLPSFNYNLPTGQEQGAFLGLEVGGSNLRMALIELNGRNGVKEPTRIRRTMVFAIDESVRLLQGHSFFDWMAEKTEAVLTIDDVDRGQQYLKNPEPMRMGVAWSFPIEQTSIKSGNVLGMGKGFCCFDAIKGHDLGEIIQQAYQRINLHVCLEAIVNDSSSTLLAQAYLDPATCLACILGTGMNAAIHLPIKSFHASKFGSRTIPQEASSSNVLTNTELSMYGKTVFPATRWDTLLNNNHTLPDYQPFEYLIAGRYMSELVRLIMVEAVEIAQLFDGSVPLSLEVPYRFETKTLAQIEADDSKDLIRSRSLLYEQCSLPRIPDFRDAQFVRQIIRSVTSRSVAYFATGIDALSSLLQESENSQDGSGHISVGCDGSVINKYPDYMQRVQSTLDQILALQNNRHKSIILQRTPESAVLGAGVAAAMAAHSLAS